MEAEREMEIHWREVSQHAVRVRDVGGVPVTQLMSKKNEAQKYNHPQHLSCSHTWDMLPPAGRRRYSTKQNKSSLRVMALSVFFCRYKEEVAGLL